MYGKYKSPYIVNTQEAEGFKVLTMDLKVSDLDGCFNLISFQFSEIK